MLRGMQRLYFYYKVNVDNRIVKINTMTTFTIITIIIFIVSGLLEVYLSAHDNLSNFDCRETRTNLCIGLIGAAFNLAIKSSTLLLFQPLQKYALFDLDNSLLTWVTALLLVDLHSYLFHFAGHKCRLFWAMHIIHHSSEKFNFTTAFRFPFTNTIFRYLTLFPLSLLGYELSMIIWCDAIVAIFIFLQHTEKVKKLGWLEYVFSTPSHHRVHHASDEKYLDKNFGGMLIIWDRLFGTFKEEEEHPTYGLTKPLEDKRIINIIFHEWKDMINDLRTAPSWSQRFHYVFNRPGWKPGKFDRA
jgi:sterol desaturase/sphingolipid hydroxylase (fatty acid hydroxylase superfamily)